MRIRIDMPEKFFKYYTNYLVIIISFNTKIANVSSRFRQVKVTSHPEGYLGPSHCCVGTLTSDPEGDPRLLPLLLGPAQRNIQRGAAAAARG